MAMTLNFFDRQTLIEGTFYSEIFETTPYTQIVTELRGFAKTGTGTATLVLEQTTDPRLNDWDPLNPSLSWSAGAADVEPTTDGLLRFVRAKVTITTGTVAVIEAIGVAREST